MGGSAADIDSDGDLDLVITEWGPNRVFLNDAGRGFKESRLVAPTDAGDDPNSVVAPSADATEWSTSSALLDYDGDGHLDLFIVNYLSFSPRTPRLRVALPLEGS